MSKYDGPPVCNDFKDRKGCGAPIRILKGAGGKIEICEPEKLPTFDKEGNLEFRFIPHWFTCPERAEYRDEYFKKQEEYRAKMAAQKRDSAPQEGSRGQQGNGQQSRGGGPQRASGGYNPRR